VLFALRELTGKDLGSSAQEWAKLLPRGGGSRRLAEVAANPALGEWKRFLRTQPGQTVKKPANQASRLAAQLVKAPASRQEALLDQIVEGEGAAYTDALADVIPRLKGDIQKTARRALVERFLFLEADQLRARMKDDDVEVSTAAIQACNLQEDQAFVPDLIALLEDSESRVVQAARQGLQKLSGKDFGPLGGAGEAQRSKAVAAWKTWWARQGKP
jgi:hypothetical protein